MVVGTKVTSRVTLYVGQRDGAAGWNLAPWLLGRFRRSRRLSPLDEILVIERMVQLHRLRDFAQPQVQHFDEDGERHREIGIAFRNVEANTVGDEVRPDQ